MVGVLHQMAQLGMQGREGRGAWQPMLSRGLGKHRVQPAAARVQAPMRVLGMVAMLGPMKTLLSRAANGPRATTQLVVRDNRGCVVLSHTQLLNRGGIIDQACNSILMQTG